MTHYANEIFYDKEKEVLYITAVEDGKINQIIVHDYTLKRALETPYHIEPDIFLRKEREELKKPKKN